MLVVRTDPYMRLTQPAEGEMWSLFYAPGAAPFFAARMSTSLSAAYRAARIFSVLYREVLISRYPFCESGMRTPARRDTNHDVARLANTRSPGMSFRLAMRFPTMMSAPVAAVGVLLTLFLTGTTLNLQSAIGCIMLGGIVVNNAILLVDHTNKALAAGATPFPSTGPASSNKGPGLKLPWLPLVMPGTSEDWDSLEDLYSTYHSMP